MIDIALDQRADSPKTPDIRLVVCLGNPGEEYSETKHNAGFMVGQEMLRQLPHQDCGWQPGNGQLVSVSRPGKTPFAVLFPMTYMNLSGESVVRVTQQFGISPSEVLVISDCMDLPFGRLRMRPRGGSGGQKGLGSIIAGLGTEAVPRLRVGIGRPQSEQDSVVDYVLSGWTSVEQETLAQVLKAAASMAVMAVDQGLEETMGQCNVWSTDNNNAEKQGVRR